MKMFKVSKQGKKTLVTERGETVIETTKPVKFVKVRRGPYFEYSISSEGKVVQFEYDPRMIKIVEGERR